MQQHGDTDSDSGQKEPEASGVPYGEDDGQDYVDRSVIDFDPADGLYSGTAVDGTSDIPEVSDQEIEDVPDDHPKPFPHDGKGPDE